MNKTAIVDDQIKNQCKAKLATLVAAYEKSVKPSSLAKMSEETVRTWLNDFLEVFGWDVRNVNQVWQETVLNENERRRLVSINSTHKRPDYTLLKGGEIKTFLDAKAPSVDVVASKAAAFQIRSYGWSAQVPCAFVSNFAQLAIFDTRFKPDSEQDASHGVIQIRVEEYVDKFDILFAHLWRGNVIADGLHRLYEFSRKEGEKALDAAFMKVLSSFRYKLAVELAKKNPKLVSDEVSLNYYVQVIMDRIIFIRVCEAKGIETKERLHEFQSSKVGFWKSFRESCYMEFYRHYDGAMFDRDANFKRIELSDKVFEDFIEELYYPSPYRFDVIPVMLLAKIYEEFLGKRLKVSRGMIVEVLKGEYVKTNGAIPTPEHIVRLVCSKTFAGADVSTIKKLLECRILDPCCGSGIFLIACYDFLEREFIKLLKQYDELQRMYEDYYFVDEEGNWLLTIPGRRLLITKCLYGIDVDEAAVEVTKMSLALKILDGNCVTIWDSLGANGERILRDIAENVKLGNALVPQSASLGRKRVEALRAFDPVRAFPAVFNKSASGFTFIVCNPPYVETKFFKEAQPAFHTYVSEHYNAYEGKADLAVLFIERCLNLLSENGKAGFIVQRRWFKTDYGKGVRRVINSGKMLEELMEFEATDIFPRRITYVAILTLAKTLHENVRYCRIEGDGDAVKFLCCDDKGMKAYESGNLKMVPHPKGDSQWDFDSTGIGELYEKLLTEHGRFDAFPNMAIKDGIQALWKKVYHLRDVEFSGIYGVGKNGFGEAVKVEKDLLRGVIYNNEFYPFKDVEPDAWCLFPYEGASANAITYSQLKDRYPLAYAYLEKNRKRITDYVECRKGEKWHTFTREHNHSLYNVNKIIVPMTARDTVATYVRGSEGLYMDNANVWFVCVDGGSDVLMKAIAAVINSTVFSVLGKLKANPQANGYYKFNKQFLAPIPFPTKALLASAAKQKKLSALVGAVSKLENKYLQTTANRQELFAQQLGMLWEELDSLVEDLYGLNCDERVAIRKIGRSVDRVNLLPKG